MAEEQTVAGSALLGDVLEALAHGGLSTAGTAVLLNRLQAAGMPTAVIKRLENAFQTRMGGFGPQDEVNNEGGCLALFFMTAAEIGELDPDGNVEGINGAEAHRRVTFWLDRVLTGHQRKQFVTKAGVKFSDTYASFRPAFFASPAPGAKTPPAETMKERIKALQLAKKELAKTYLPFALKGPAGSAVADEERTRLAIAMRWIGKTRGLSLEGARKFWTRRNEEAEEAHEIMDELFQSRKRKLEEKKRKIEELKKRNGR